MKKEIELRKKNLQRKKEKLRKEIGNAFLSPACWGYLSLLLPPTRERESACVVLPAPFRLCLASFSSARALKHTEGRRSAYNLTFSFNVPLPFALPYETEKETNPKKKFDDQSVFRKKELVKGLFMN